MPDDISVHDNQILRYTVDASAKRIRIETVYFRAAPEPDEYTDVTFSDVLAYHFESDTLGTILFDIEETTPERICAAYADLFAALKNHGWPGFLRYAAPDELPAVLRAAGVRAFEISAAVGLYGFVLAKRMERTMHAGVVRTPPGGESQ